MPSVKARPPRPPASRPHHTSQTTFIPSGPSEADANKEEQVGWCPRKALRGRIRLSTRHSLTPRGCQTLHTQVTSPCPPQPSSPLQTKAGVLGQGHSASESKAWHTTGGQCTSCTAATSAGSQGVPRPRPNDRVRSEGPRKGRRDEGSRVVRPTTTWGRVPTGRAVGDVPARHRYDPRRDCSADTAWEAGRGQAG